VDKMSSSGLFPAWEFRAAGAGIRFYSVNTILGWIRKDVSLGGISAFWFNIDIVVQKNRE
jgi:hypothetical protein